MVEKLTAVRKNINKRQQKVVKLPKKQQAVKEDMINWISWKQLEAKGHTKPTIKEVLKSPKVHLERIYRKEKIEVKRKSTKNYKRGALIPYYRLDMREFFTYVKEKKIKFESFEKRWLEAVFSNDFVREDVAKSSDFVTGIKNILIFMSQEYDKLINFIDIIQLKYPELYAKYEKTASNKSKRNMNDLLDFAKNNVKPKEKRWIIYSLLAVLSPTKLMGKGKDVTPVGFLEQDVWKIIAGADIFNMRLKLFKCYESPENIQYLRKNMEKQKEKTKEFFNFIDDKDVEKEIKKLIRNV